MDFLLDPYQSEFMRNAAMAAVLVGILAPTVGVWITLRRLSYLGDAMAHGTLAGVAGAFILGVSVTLGALAAGLVMGALIAVLSSRRRLGEDSVIGVVETIFFAVGVILISRNDKKGVELGHYLFGQLTTVNRNDLIVNGVLAFIALFTITVLFRDLLASTFDPIHARQVGVRVGAIRYLIMAMVSVTVVVSLQTVGLLMSVAMLVTPASAARLVTNRVGTMTIVGIGIGVSSALGGLTVSYHLRSAPGATIALLSAAILLVTFAVTAPRRRHIDHDNAESASASVPH